MKTKSKTIYLILLAILTCSQFLFAGINYFSNDTYNLQIDFSNGICSVFSKSGTELISANSLFTVGFENGFLLTDSDSLITLVSNTPLSAFYQSSECDIQLIITPETNRVLFDTQVACKSSVPIISVGAPGGFDIVGTPRSRFYWPRALGTELTENWLASSASEWQYYPPAFSDFAGAEVSGNSVYFYRTGTESRPRSAYLSIDGGNPPVYKHRYFYYLESGTNWTAPTYALQVGGDLRKTLLRYKTERNLGKPIQEKCSTNFYQKWSKMAIAYVVPPFDKMTKSAMALSLPAVLEPGSWMFGGFDRKYPDFLPPNPDLGGEQKFREFIQAAHQSNHFVRPYINFTWWCTGWNPGGGEPAPSYVTYGDVALSRDKNDNLIFENYYGNYGYRSCPEHPVNKLLHQNTRNDLLNDYGVDYLYQDQLGARGFLNPLDYNSSMKNPADYAWAIQQLGVIAAQDCPIGIEMCNDLMLEYALLGNYWALMPNRTDFDWSLAGILPPKKPNEEVFPFALFLSTGDTVMHIPEQNYPNQLAWGLLLGSPVTLGPLTVGIEAGPMKNLIKFLQILAKDVGERVRADKLLAFDRLTNDVLRSTFENHSVIANFSTSVYEMTDGTLIAPNGFDLQISNDSFRAGCYLASNNQPVWTIFNPENNKIITLGPLGVDVTVGQKTVNIDEKPNHAITNNSVFVANYGSGIIDNGLGAIAANTILTEFAPLNPQSVTSLLDFPGVLTNCRVFVNPHTEYLVVDDTNNWTEGCSIVRDWIEAGGIWVECGGYPGFLVAQFVPAALPGTKMIFEDGFLSTCDQKCRYLDNDEQSATVTSLGTSVFSTATISSIESIPCVPCRPPKSVDDTMILVNTSTGAYISVRQVGYGAMVRVCGLPNSIAPTALREIVSALLAENLKLDDNGIWRKHFRETSFFEAETQKIVVTEIMYNPSGGDEFEFIELKNISGDNLDISKVSLINGIDFSFAGSAVTNLQTDDYVVVVKSNSAFASLYETNDILIAGEFIGNLDDSNEKIGVQKSGQNLLDFTYYDSWYPTTDGGGYSLVIENPLAETNMWDKKEGWRPSYEINGSPGKEDTPEPSYYLLFMACYLLFFKFRNQSFLSL